MIGCVHLHAKSTFLVAGAALVVVAALAGCSSSAPAPTGSLAPAPSGSPTAGNLVAFLPTTSEGLAALGTGWKLGQKPTEAVVPKSDQTAAPDATACTAAVYTIGYPNPGTVASESYVDASAAELTLYLLSFTDEKGAVALMSAASTVATACASNPELGIASTDPGIADATAYSFTRAGATTNDVYWRTGSIVLRVTGPVATTPVNALAKAGVDKLK